MLALVRLRWIVLALFSLSVAGCNNFTGTSFHSGVGADRADRPLFTEPALIAYDTQTGALEYWTIQHGGGTQLKLLSGPLDVYGARGMAANGNVVAIAGYGPPKVVTYDVVTKAKATMNDPYGEPYDVAIDRRGNIYALNDRSVAVFKTGSLNPAKLSCPYMDNSESIAVNDEGDVLVNGLGPAGFMGVVEYPAGSTKCLKLPLRPVHGSIAGIGVDPKTDDLIVLDNPDECAGGFEGRMLIYPKPYEARTAVRHTLLGTLCPQRFRLDASSTHIFVADSDYLGFPFIDQNRYPTGKNEGTYTNGYYASGNFTGYTTIPNRLPN